MWVTPGALAALIPASWLLWSLWRRRDIAGAHALIVHTLVGSFWLLTYAFQLDSQTVEMALLWRKVKYLGISFAAVSWVVFALQYAGFGRLLTGRRVLALMAVPTVTSILAMTNELHQLLWRGTPTTPFEVGIMPYGPAFYGLVAFSYCAVLLASLVLAWTLMRSGRLYGGQIVGLLTAIGLPVVASAVYVAGLMPVPGLDPTSLAYVVTDIILGWSILRYGVLKGSVGVVPFARARVVDALRDGVIVLDHQLRIVDVNPAAARFLERDPRHLIGMPHIQVLPMLAGRIDLFHSEERTAELTLGQGRALRHCVVRVTPVGGLTSATDGWLLTLTDLTERKEAEAALEESERRYRTVVNTLSEVVFQTDARRCWSLLNPAWTTLTGFSMIESLGQQVSLYVHPDDRARDEREAVSLLNREKELARYEVRLVQSDDAVRWVEMHARPIVDQSGAITGLSGTLVDVTERKRLEEQLVHQAFHDALTGLANRTLFRDRVSHTLARASRSAAANAVLFLDLDNFKKVNDSLGHAAGDELLRGIAQRLVANVRGLDTVARLGGDEFAILLEDLPSQDEAIVIGERILESLRQPILVNGKEVLAGASIGLAPIKRDSESADALLRNADIAMYVAKRGGRGRLAIYSDGMDAATRNRLELEADLYRAVDRNELLVMYQPTIDIDSGQVIGAEALVRWQHPERGMIHPVEFITIAEETGLILPIGHWVLRQACRDVLTWKKLDPAYADISVAVNISARQLQEPQLVERVADLLVEHALDPASLTLEITESVAMQNTEATIARLEALKSLGVHIAIDDFGTGYSSLSYLQRFPIDILKIDRAFVQGIAENGDDHALAQTIVQLARTLRLSTVAEGIETVEQLECLRALGCDHGQGYLFARPIPAGQLSDLLAASLHVDIRNVA
ncbi:MAG: EAL domain-containing protein [Chloroflexi bacterium]|nr:EAL domain-containing protein [Chloroflexota bacterium]